MKTVSEKWDDGCKSDHVRNSFIIPTLVKLFAELGADRVLDVGAGTGYIARSVDAKLTERINWTLLDLDKSSIEFANSHIPDGMQAETYVGNFLEDWPSGEPYNFVLILFTLLEMELNLDLFSKISEVLNESGHVVIAIPDTLEDVHKDAITQPSLLIDFLDGNCILKKIDKFTTKSYPFKAHRFENIVLLMLNSSFSLVKMYSFKNSGNETYMLVFRKMMAN